ncbi:MAG: hypothetical protein HFI60_18940 [Lachnospiraceae bacterium]|nr:hypothetical protein [Lachnospiraceae bacterium]
MNADSVKKVGHVHCLYQEINSNFGGCSFEQEGNDFYITGADAVRKKLGDSVDITGSFSLAVSYRNAGYDSSSISLSTCSKKCIEINISNTYTTTTVSIGNASYTESGIYDIEDAENVVISTRFVSAPSGVTGGRCSGNYRLS